MTENGKGFWNAMRIGGPIVIFCIVLLALNYGLDVPLVLAVVIACLVAIVDFAILNWLIRRKTDNN